MGARGGPEKGGKLDSRICQAPVFRYAAQHNAEQDGNDIAGCFPHGAETGDGKKPAQGRPVEVAPAQPEIGCGRKARQPHVHERGGKIIQVDEIGYEASGMLPELSQAALRKAAEKQSGSSEKEKRRRTEATEGRCVP